MNIQRNERAVPDDAVDSVLGRGCLPGLPATDQLPLPVWIEGVQLLECR